MFISCIFYVNCVGENTTKVNKYRKEPFSRDNVCSIIFFFLYELNLSTLDPVDSWLSICSRSFRITLISNQDLVLCLEVIMGYVYLI